jgi:hypothetical protein
LAVVTAAALMRFQLAPPSVERHTPFEPRDMTR